MNIWSGATRIAMVVLAAIGAFVVLGSLGMLFMHGAMMRGLPFQGALSSMLAACRGMMGG
jgi:hypothetical protein